MGVFAGEGLKRLVIIGLACLALFLVISIRWPAGPAIAGGGCDFGAGFDQIRYGSIPLFGVESWWQLTCGGASYADFSASAKESHYVHFHRRCRRGSWRRSDSARPMARKKTEQFDQRGRSVRAALAARC